MDRTPQAVARAKRFREPVSGFSHLTGLGFAVVGLAWLFVRTPRDGASLAAFALYAIGLVAVYSASSAYHLVVAREEIVRRLRLLDHMAIFLLVAGTSTPFMHRGLSGAPRVLMLSGLWGAAVLGIAFKLAWRSAPRALYTVLYVAMGWSVTIEWKKMIVVLPSLPLRLLVAGGVAYTVGALVYALKRPNPWPGRFGFHEIWHLFVLAGSALHFWAIATLPRT